MDATGGNFTFLDRRSPQLAKLGQLAERYFSDDPPAALFKLRQFAEIVAKEIAARQALLSDSRATFDDVLGTLRSRSVLQREMADLFYHLKRMGNAAAHEDKGTAGDALTALKIARAIGIWFHQTYEAAPAFKPGPFLPPAPPVDASIALRQELAALKSAVTASTDAEAKALLKVQEAELARLELEGQSASDCEQRAFWENYAAETEAALRAAEQRLTALQQDAAAEPAHQLEFLAYTGATAAEAIELDEATTRVLIDEQLRAAGWKADSLVLRHSSGTRAGQGEAIAIAEWPTRSGPVDYALFVDGRCVGVIEAKRQIRDVPGRLARQSAMPAQPFARER